MKNIKIALTTFVLTLSFASLALFGIGEDEKGSDKEKTAEECEIPAFAKAIGHEDLWLKHNGCPPREKQQETDKE